MPTDEVVTQAVAQLRKAFGEGEGGRTIVLGQRDPNQHAQGFDVVGLIFEDAL